MMSIANSNNKYSCNGNICKRQKVEPSSWTYDDSDEECGPNKWLQVFGDQNCGKHQSPIAISLSQLPTVSAHSFPFKLVGYRNAISGQVTNTGHSVQFDLESSVEPPEISGGMLDQSYRFVQYHFHWAQNDSEGSEHVINRTRYPAELHLVHKGVQDPSKLAVLGIFLKIIDNANDFEEQSFCEKECLAFSKALNFDQKTINCSSGQLIAKLPKNCHDFNLISEKQVDTYVSQFIRYKGSLTTPPCSENVQWTMFLNPIYITREQIKILRSVKDCSGKVISKNYRPAQHLNDRKIIYASL